MQWLAIYDFGIDCLFVKRRSGPVDPVAEEAGIEALHADAFVEADCFLLGDQHQADPWPEQLVDRFEEPGAKPAALCAFLDRELRAVGNPREVRDAAGEAEDDPVLTRGDDEVR